MTDKELFNLILSPEYDFLRKNEHLGNNIILLGLGGSYAYGTNVETSDIDIRGIALNTREELLTNVNFEQFVDNGTDTTIYSFNKILSLLSNCNPNTIEILGLKPEHYLMLSDAGKLLLDNKELFLSKRAIKTFGGYANQQLYRLNNIAAHNMSQEELEKHILRTIENLSEDFTEKYHLSPENALKLFIDNSEREDMNTEIFMDINLSHYPLRDYASMWNELQNIAKSYNKLGMRNDKALEHGKISKHMMHLVRLYLMCSDILNYGEINTYRDKDHDLLMEIRGGKYITEDNQVKPEFFQLVDKLEEQLNKDKQNTKLPDSPDYKKINQLMMQVNEAVILGRTNQPIMRNSDIIGR